jgi:uncharacterized membrane protein
MPVHISRGRLSWLEGEAGRWRDDGVIDEPTRARIVGGYVPVSAERRSLIALVVVAVLMCAVGLVLLIGYNWDRIPPAAKIGTILIAVAGAFGAASLCYARGRNAPGEMVAFAGTLVFGNGIWLIAQVLHIEGHFPDAFYWFGMGALACAVLLRSRLIGVEAALIFAFWTFAEGVASPRPTLWFIPIWIVLVVHAYRVSSPVLLRVVALLAPAWVAAATGQAAGGPFWLGATALAAGAMFSLGAWLDRDPVMQRAWQEAGLVALLAVLIPLMVTAVHRDLGAGRADTTSLAIAVVAATVGLSALLKTTRDIRQLAIVGAVSAIATWTIAVGFGVLPSRTAAGLVSAIGFSAVTLGVGVSLVRAALKSSRTTDLALGVLFALSFLIVRWASLVENLLWSGSLLLATGGGLLLVARLWRHRDRRAVASRRLS